MAAQGYIGRGPGDGSVELLGKVMLSEVLQLTLLLLLDIP